MNANLSAVNAVYFQNICIIRFVYISMFDLGDISSFWPEVAQCFFKIFLKLTSLALVFSSASTKTNFKNNTYIHLSNTDKIREN